MKRAVGLGATTLAFVAIVWLPSTPFLNPGTVSSYSQSRGLPPDPIDLKVFAGHPRCVFRPSRDRGLGRTFDDIRELHGSDPTFQAIMARALIIDPARQHPAANAVCWIVSGDQRFADAAFRQLTEEPITESGDGGYSSIWSFALAFDWLFHHPAMTETARGLVESRLRERLASEVEGLDRDYMALWHGRNQAANGAIIAALVLADRIEGTGLLERAAGHWLESLRALRFSEGWPEGASYWIYNRAGPYALAADSVLSSTGREEIAGISIRQVMRTIGLWQLYQYGPNGVFEPYGDSAGSLRLGETGWWTLTTDYFARLSRDPGLAAAGDYFRTRSPDPYGKRAYHWYVALAYDPAFRPKEPEYDPARAELWMRGHLPQAMLFGRDSYGVAFLRGEWGSDKELFASFKAGDLLAHHDHYDTGNLTLQYGGNLLPQTGFYGYYYGSHRLGYQIQTVSANSLLVLAPGEFSNYLRRNPNWWPWLSGGQRVIAPTGFDCVSVGDFKSRLVSGPHLERATITAWESRKDLFDYIAADLTAAYNSSRFSEPGNRAKLSLVTRQLLYLRESRAFVLFDRVETPGPGFVSKALFHSLSKPESATENVLEGARDNGILETRDSNIFWKDGAGRLDLRILLPVTPRILKIGGPDYCFYVESDGDQNDGFDGQNLTEGAERRGGMKQVDQWRIEVEPEKQENSNRFLTILVPRLINEGSLDLDVEMLPGDPSTRLIRIGTTLVAFSDAAAPLSRLKVPGVRTQRCILLDAVPEAVYSLNGDRTRASREGVLVVEVGRPEPAEIRIVP